MMSRGYRCRGLPDLRNGSIILSGATAVAVLDAGNIRFGHAAGSDTAASQRIAHLFAQSKSRVATVPLQVAIAEPAAARFAGTSASLDVSERIALAYADPSPAATTGALAALSTLAPSDEDMFALSNPDDESSDEDLLLPDDAALSEDGSLPEAGPRPVVRPRVEQPEAPAMVDKPTKDAKRQKLAYARPDEPVDDRPTIGFGRGLRNLFGGGARAGNGVAVYDISAETVYMPDGSTLEAHSGIGKMADNPRYAHVKMNGPTPPHTYNLRMRETRFHGVEAIRMIPVDGKNPHGRTGLLTHSYLLRGGRAESHGCVAFKDYKRFLAAFKKGHVKQLVVVSSGGRAVARSAKKGRDA